MSKEWAFLISVAEYEEKELNLLYVHGDNACIKHGLVNGLLIPEEQIVICGDNCYVRFSDFQSVVSSFVNKIAPSDRVIVFFSGHGGGAPYSLFFSDTEVAFTAFCDEINKLAACAKILIIDSCYSGNSETPELTIANPSQNLFNYVQSGFAIFASSNEGSTSSRHPEEAVSLYTYCFSNALCNARIYNGNISLIDVAKNASIEADYISKKHGERMQHPIYKCQIPGDVVFQITEENKTDSNIYSSCNEQYSVYLTNILHSCQEMRYRVFAIAKCDIDENSIARYTKQIVQELAPIRKFSNTLQAVRFLGETVKVVFVFWGRNEADIVRRNWIYRSVWADKSSNRTNWYRVNNSSKILSDIWVEKCPYYNMLENLYETNSVSNSELVRLTHQIADPLLQAAHEVVSYFEEYDNGEIPEYAFIQACTEPFKAINSCYWRMSSLPIPSVELKEWADCYDSLTAAIDDMRIHYSSSKHLDGEERNRKVCMRATVRRYREDLHKLVHVEEALKENGIL